MKAETERTIDRLSFAVWMAQVDSILDEKTGLSYRDLPDCCYMDWYEDGVSPRSAACRAMRAANE
jgi:hypothetical protein